MLGAIKIYAKDPCCVPLRFHGCRDNHECLSWWHNTHLNNMLGVCKALNMYYLDVVILSILLSNAKYSIDVLPLPAVSLPDLMGYLRVMLGVSQTILQLRSWGWEGGLHKATMTEMRFRSGKARFTSWSHSYYGTPACHQHTHIHILLV